MQLRLWRPITRRDTDEDIWQLKDCVQSSFYMHVKTALLTSTNSLGCLHFVVLTLPLLDIETVRSELLGR
jgi:hypothetical protein